MALKVTVVVVLGCEEEESRDRLRHQSKRAKILSLEMMAMHDANVSMSASDWQCCVCSQHHMLKTKFPTTAAGHKYAKNFMMIRNADWV